MINKLNQKEVDCVHGGFTASKNRVAAVLYTTSLLVFITSFMAGFYYYKQQINSAIALDSILKLGITSVGIVLRFAYRNLQLLMACRSTSNYKIPV